MASVGTLSLFFPVFVPASGVAAAYLGHRATKVDWRAKARHFLTGPGRLSRILLVFFLVTNWKSLPFAWTIRIFYAFIYHFTRRRPTLPPRALFHYSITSTRNSLLDSDYNLHKSNSTYFADLDVSRSHLVTHLLGPAMPRIGDNAKNRLVLDKDGFAVRGGFGIGLGAVFCSFRKEIGLLQGYETWSRILSWDRKWLYIVTHFVVKGKVKPTSWDGRARGPVRPKNVKVEGGGVAKEDEFGKWVIATAVSKYVFKLGRFTVHPAIVIKANGLLPARPDGWMGGESGVGTPEELGDIDEVGEWDWRRVEYERRKGMEYAEHFAALDGANGLFDGGEDGALGHFALG
ncbi:hypothetical protein CONLIGDRAFT_674380 [Coniochaeta ligniaria NRRL 30616]|uniref:Capsule polysaccharide biosynthesis protein n=1 Tax=Coniochaeta ligniaria NRRL 30616 TaxID=1408157 RepID=A0A1J7IR26_9PEZI|nr:hypothetical protein CONLIGDRAFT_674380 [Coniochaeta ligniaria NRRL 30616]